MSKTISAKETHTRERLATPTDLKPEATRDISAALAGLLADVFALYLKTKNFHWHMSGQHFRDYHLLLDEQGDQIFAMTDPIAERARKIGGTTLRSIGDIARPPAHRRQRRRVRRPAGHARRAARGQRAPDRRSCARFTTSATSTAMSRRRASWKSGSTRPSGAPGSCSNRPATPRGPTTDRTRRRREPRPFRRHARLATGDARAPDRFPSGLARGSR